MKKIILFSLLAVSILAVNSSTITLINGFALNYTIDSKIIKFQLTGKNKGYVALGIGGNGMSKIDVAAFKWDGSKVVGEDRSNLITKYEIHLDTYFNCYNNIRVDPSSSYNNSTGSWNIKWARKLDTGDQTCDQVIVEGASTNIAFALMSDFNWEKHIYHDYKSVIFSSEIIVIPNNNNNNNDKSFNNILTFSSLFFIVVLTIF